MTVYPNAQVSQKELTDFLARVASSCVIVEQIDTFRDWVTGLKDAGQIPFGTYTGCVRCCYDMHKTVIEGSMRQRDDDYQETS